jgi:hypothetical protein
LQQTKQRRLIGNPADKHRVPTVARQRHALKQRADWSLSSPSASSRYVREPIRTPWRTPAQVWPMIAVITWVKRHPQ